MSSPRPERKPLALDPETYGDTPAAIYLVECLNQRNDPLLARKVAKLISENQEILADLGRAHLDFDVLSTRTFARLLPLISKNNQERVDLSLRQHDNHIANLTTNVLEGKIKSWQNRVMHARRKQSKIQREAGPGVSVDWVPAAPLVGEKTGVKLQQKSKEYLARKSKPDTLY